MPQSDFSFLPFGAGGIPANANSGTSLAAPRWYYGTAAPTTAAAPAGGYNLGDIVFNVNQSAGAPLGWICTTGGSSFVFTALANSVTTTTNLTTTATSGTLTGNVSLQLLNPASTGTYSIPDAAANLAGFGTTFKNIASGSVTLTPLGSNNYADAAAITLAQFGSVTLKGNGSTTWFRAQ